jgi:selenocysteine-specific elongation factor
MTAQALAVACKLRPEDVEARLAELVQRGEVVIVQKTGHLTRESFATAVSKLLATVESHHARHPLRKWVELRDLRTETRLPEATLHEAVEAAVAQGSILAEKGGRLRAASFKPQLSPKQESMLELLRATFATADVNPPSAAEAAAKVGESEAAVESLMRLLAEEGELVKAGEYHFHHTAVARAAKLLVEDTRPRGGEVNIPALRDLLGTSRKYMIPLLEYFDTTGITVRRGDKRLLRGKQE